MKRIMNVALSLLFVCSLFIAVQVTETHAQPHMDDYDQMVDFPWNDDHMYDDDHIYDDDHMYDDGHMDDFPWNVDHMIGSPGNGTQAMFWMYFWMIYMMFFMGPGF